MRNLSRMLAGAVLAVWLVPAPALGGEAAKEGVEQDPVFAPFLRYPIAPEAERSSTLIFSHKLHRKKKVDCVDCHAQAETARTTQLNLIPTEDSCFECHDASERENCEMCHEGKPRGRPHEESEIRFDHAGHLEREGVECKTCHPKAPDAETSDVRLKPDMATCTQCHDHEADMNRLNCSRCHTHLPEKGALPQDEPMHGAGFVPMHAAWAAGGAARCAQCHEESFCADCHAATTRPLTPSQLMPESVERWFIHRGSYLDRHALEAQAQPVSCSNCHGESFCLDCHESQIRAAGGGLKASPHPAGYVLRGGAAFHGTDARMNPQNCAACHDQGAASNCVQCHRVGAPGGNPHPPGWNRNGPRDEKTRSGACVPCHGGGG